MQELLPEGYYATRDELRRRLSEPSPGRVQLLTGPRQVGKTTLLLGLASEWGERSIYVAADAPEAALPGWWETQWQRASRMAGSQDGVLLVDEIQYLPDWSKRLKAESDRVRRESIPLHVVVSGSAALKLGAGSRETMAGRFERLTITHWSSHDLEQAFHLSAEEAARVVVAFGGFPGAMSLRQDFQRWRAYIRDSIIDPAVGRDILALETVRKPSLLRQIFAVCVGHPSEIVSLQKIAGSLADQGALATVAHYLELLREAYLVAALQKHSRTEVRRRASPPKLVPLNNAFIIPSMFERPPSPWQDAPAWGRLVENACIAFMVNRGQTVTYWREEPLEVDAVIDGSWGRWVVEIKTSAFTTRDLSGLLEFARRWPDYRPLVICEEEHSGTARGAGVDALSWTRFLGSGVEGLG